MSVNAVSARDACDFPAFVARLGGDAILAREMAVIFLDDAGRLMTAVREAIDGGRPADLNAAAHALKGAASNFNAAAVVHAAAALEAMGQTGDLAEARTTLQALERASQTMIRVLRMAIEDGTQCAS